MFLTLFRIFRNMGMGVNILDEVNIASEERLAMLGG